MERARLGAGLYEAVVTTGLGATLEELDDAVLHTDIGDLANAEAADRLSRHVGRIVARAIEAAPDRDRAATAVRVARSLVDHLGEIVDADVGDEVPVDPGQVLHGVLRRRPDGTPATLERPLTPLLDTTVLTNAPGEPAVLHELRAEIPSADSIDVVMAFVRWSGIRPLLDALRQHCDDGKRLRVLTTSYTNSTEARALEELAELGAEVRVSYDTSSTRLHAKAWLFSRRSGYSTAYVGSSNLTHSAQVSGIEWNLRVAEARNHDAIAKIAAVFETYWENHDFVPYDATEFQRRTRAGATGAVTLLSPVEIELRPFQERLLDLVSVARRQGHHRNLLVAATGTGKTVMAAVDYARLRRTSPRSRLLFVAHRHEILEQSRATFRHALRDAAFGELWVSGQRPLEFDHVFASIQSLNATGIERIEPGHFDVVIVDEFHHAAAPSYRALLERVEPVELIGLTATPERSDGLDVLRYFDGRIAAELRLWDAIDQHYLAPFMYFGIFDGTDLRELGWRRGRGYDPDELTNLLTADHALAHRIVEQVHRCVADPQAMRALGFCVSVGHARFMAERFNHAGLPSVAISGDSGSAEREAALADLRAGRIRCVFTVDLFNEGIDVPDVDTLLLLRPTESGTLFLQQLGRGLRRSEGKTSCAVLDFVSQHRREFRYDRRFRALLGGSRLDAQRQVEAGFPFLPAGCHLELDRVASDIVLRSLREALPTGWRERVAELRSLGDVSLAEFVSRSGLDLEDVYSSNHSWSELRRAAGLPGAPEGDTEAKLLRAVGRMLHVDDPVRIDGYRRLVTAPRPPSPASLPANDALLLRMLIAALTPRRPSDSLEVALDELWEHPQVLSELAELLDLLSERINHDVQPLATPAGTPLQVHARYTRLEIQAAFGLADGAKPATWQTGVLWDETSRTDLFAFTLDKTQGGFSPTTRYRDYAISRELIHWESQSNTSAAGHTGQRYIHHREEGTNIVLFARLHTGDRAFWCLGPADYVTHQGDRPIAFTWRLHHPLPADLFTAFAAAAV